MKPYDRSQNKLNKIKEIVDSTANFWYWEDYDPWYDPWCYDPCYEDPIGTPEYRSKGFSLSQYAYFSKKNGVYIKDIRTSPVAEIDPESYLSKSQLRNRKIEQILDEYSPYSLKNIAKF